MKVFLKDAFVEEGQATVSVFDHGLLYGDGVFQLVGIWGGRLFALREHLDYLRENAAAIFLTLPYDEERLVSLCEETCGLSGLKRGVLRVMLTRGEGSLGISIRSCKEPILIIVPHACEEAVYVDPLDIVTVPLRRNSVNAVSPMVKSLNGLNEVLARMEALGGGYQEGVLLNQEGFVTSCASSSLFIVRSGTLYTSALSAGVPREVMRGKVLELAATLGIPCQEVLLTRYDLWVAHECFLVDSVGVLRWVDRVDNRAINGGKQGTLTCKINQALKNLLLDIKPPRLEAC